MIKVLLVDDEELVRSGLRLILGTTEDIEVVCECADGAQVYEAVRRYRPDVVLLDIRMPGTNGLVAMERLQTLPDPPRVAVLTTFDVDDYVSQAVRLGASGFLLKHAEPDQLVRAVRDIAAGGAVLDPGVASRLLVTLADGHRVAEPARQLLAGLSDREREVLGLLGKGMSNAEIGATLHLSEATVKGYVSSVLGKVGATNRVQAALVAYRAGLVG